MDSRNSTPVFHVQEVWLPFLFHLLSFYCVHPVHHLSLTHSLIPWPPTRQLQPGDSSISWSLGKQSQVVQGSETQLLQVGWELSSSPPMWWFSSRLPGGKDISSVLDALGPFHCCQRMGGSLQVQVVPLTEEGEEVVGLSALCVDQDCKWRFTRHCDCLQWGESKLPQPWVEMEPRWFWWQWPHITNNVMLRLSLGVLLWRLLAGWFLWAPCLQELLHRGWVELGLWQQSWGPFLLAAQGCGNVFWLPNLASLP